MRTSARRRAIAVTALTVVALSGACASAHAPARVDQAMPSATRADAPHAASTTVPVPGGCNEPRPGPPDAIGCYLAAVAPIGPATASQLYWYIDAFPDRAAADAARRQGSTVATAHGRTWLFTIAEAGWPAAGGDRIAVVGPFPVTRGRVYTAHYLEGVVPAAARTPVHKHPGPEGWFVLEGAQCLETPEGFKVVRAGESYVVQEGPPMLLGGMGSSVRRTLGLVLHDAQQPWTIPTNEWTPKESCPH